MIGNGEGRRGGRGIVCLWCLLGCGGRDGGGFFGANDMGKKMERVEGKGRFVNRWIAPSWWRGWRVLVECDESPAPGRLDNKAGRRERPTAGP